MNNKKINEFISGFINSPISVKILKTFKIFRGSKKNPPVSIKKILIIKLEGLGDSIYITEIIHRLKEECPCLKIDVLTTKQNPIFSTFKETNDEFDIISFNPLNLIDYFKIIGYIKKNEYDAVFDMTGMPVNIPLMLFFVNSYKTGFNTAPVKTALYDRLVNLEADIHIFENYLNLFTPLFDIKKLDKQFTLKLPALEKESKELKKGGYINLALSSNSGGLMHRMLPLANSLKLINLLRSEFVNYEINLLGGQNDYKYLELINNNLKEKASIKKTKSIKEVFLLLQNSFLNICIDSGLMHISSLVNQNTYCLFGYSNPKNSLPFNNIGYFWSNLDCSPCSFYKISACNNPVNLKCMEEINIDKVIEDVRLKGKAKTNI